ncbi:MAG: GNAT family N-acetyltransferase [Actinomycetota bacterium]
MAPGLLLRPIRAATAAPDHPDVGLLTDARNRNVRSFLTEFVATREQTARWLREVVTANPGKLLFVLESDAGAVGYMGLDFIDWDANSGEIDAIVRTGAPYPGAMTIGTRALIAWARAQLQLDEIQVQVRSDNPALAFYRQLGFRELARVPLRQEHDAQADKISWLEDPTLSEPELWLVRHVYEGPSSPAS